MVNPPLEDTLSKARQEAQYFDHRWSNQDHIQRWEYEYHRGEQQLYSRLVRFFLGKLISLDTQAFRVNAKRLGNTRSELVCLQHHGGEAAKLF